MIPKFKDEASSRFVVQHPDGGYVSRIGFVVDLFDAEQFESRSLAEDYIDATTEPDKWIIREVAQGDL